ncbi:MAG: hypothetical protein AAF525_02155, partial [Pseudomonadota bacterium]
MIEALFRDDKMLGELRNISYFELSELLLLTYSTLIDQLSVLLTVTFGYFVAAYLVGKRLTVFQGGPDAGPEPAARTGSDARSHAGAPTRSSARAA